MADSTEGQEERPKSDLAAAVEEMRKQSAAVRELQEQFKGIHVKQIYGGGTRSPSPNSRRVHFEDQQPNWRESPPSTSYTNRYTIQIREVGLLNEDEGQVNLRDAEISMGNR